ncbi:MAG: hypothetical protein H0X62_03115 [Bacteroidetes bacterium]|nr:hypothetical protein [Bacteroidota bacterium]
MAKPKVRDSIKINKNEQFHMAFRKQIIHIMKTIALLFTVFLLAGHLLAQVPEGQPRLQEEQNEELRQEELEQEAPKQQPQQLEQEGEVTPPGQDEEDIEKSEEFEASPPQFDGEALSGRYEQKKNIEYRGLPETVQHSFENSYFSDWEVLEVYHAHEAGLADYIIKVEKDDTEMYLHFQENGELIMQEKLDLD